MPNIYEVNVKAREKKNIMLRGNHTGKGKFAIAIAN